MEKIQKIKITATIDGKKQKIKIQEDKLKNLNELKKEISNVIDELHSLEKSTKKIYNICCFDCFKIKDNNVDMVST